MGSNVSTQSPQSAAPVVHVQQSPPPTTSKSGSGSNGSPAPTPLQPATNFVQQTANGLINLIEGLL